MKIKVIISPFLEEIYSTFFEYLKSNKKTKFFSYNFSSPVLDDVSLDERQTELDSFLITHLQNVIKAIEQITTVQISPISLTIYLTKYPIRTFSSPIIIYPRKNVFYNFSTIIHEILHTILKENLNYQKLEQILEKLFPNQNKNTQIHILVYSLMIETFKKTNLLENGLMDQERLDAQNHSDNSYHEAFTIIDKQGSDSIVSLIKSKYTN